MDGLDTTRTANAGSIIEKQQGDYTLNVLALATGKQANNPDLTPYTLSPIALIKCLSEPELGTKDGGAKYHSNNLQCFYDGYAVINYKIIISIL